jgi:hypothetical protein
MPNHVGARANMRVVRVGAQNGGFGLGRLESQVHDVDHLQIGLARIKTAFKYLQGADIANGHAHQWRSGSFQRSVRRIGI